MGPATLPPSRDQNAASAAAVTEQEVQTLAGLATGATAQAAARRLGVSDRTVRRRVRKVCARAGVDTTVEAVTWAARRGLI